MLKSSAKTITPRRLLIVVLILGAILRIGHSLRPWDDLLSWSLFDDAFYYWQTARHIVAGRGATFDGVNLTNGFHPFWEVVSIAVFALAHDPEVGARVLLVLAACADVATIWCLWRAAGYLTTQPVARLVPTVIWGLYPAILLLTQNGLETAFTGLIVTAALWAFLRILRCGWTTGRVALLGALLGAAVLARTDNGLLVAVLLGSLLITQRRLKPVVATGALASLISLPWFVWSWATFGTIVQSSAWATAQVYREEALQQTSSALDPIVFRGVYLIRMALAVPELMGLGRSLYQGALWLAGAGMVALLAHRLRRGGAAQQVQKVESNTAAVLTLLFWPVVFFLVHTALRWEAFRGYYYASVLPATLLACVPLVASLLTIPRSRWLRPLGWVWLALYPALFLWGSVAVLAAGAPLSWQPDMRRAALFIKSNTPPDAVVGAANAGIVSWWSDRRVVNLDGLINNAAAQALAERRLADYLAEQGICYVVDPLLPSADSLFDEPFWGRPVAYETLWTQRVSYLDGSWTVVRLERPDCPSRVW